MLHRRRHDDVDVIVVDGHRRHRGGRHHGHGDRVEVIGKRRHNDDVVIVDDYHRHHDDVVVVDGDRHGRHGNHDNVHSHIHAHGDNVVINQKRRSRDETVVVAGGRHSDVTVVDGHGHRGATVVEGSRHGTTVVEGGRHGTTVIESGRHRHEDVTVVGRDLVDLDARRHGHADIVVVDEHGHHDRHSHRHPVTVVTRDNLSQTQLRMGGEGEDIVVGKDKHEPGAHLGKRHSSKTNVIVTDGPAEYYDDGYYRYPSDSLVLDRPGYDGRVRVVEGGRYSRHRGGRNKRSHGDDDRHERHGGRHCHHGHCHDGEDVKVIAKRDNGLEMGGAPGYIDVTSAVFNSTTAQRIASLVLSTTNGTESDSSFVLNASNNIRTQVYLVPTNSTASEASAPAGNSSGPIKVNLKLPIFVAQSASVEAYCATFDRAPTTPGPLFVTKCQGGEQDADSSQVFLYDPDTGIIHPDWDPSPAAKAVLDAVPDNVDEEGLNAQATEGDVESDEGAVEAEAAAASSTGPTLPSSTSSAPSAPSATASVPPPLVTSGAKSSTDSTSLDSKASNVTLVFTPVNPTVNQASVMYDANEEPMDGTDFNGQDAPSSDASQPDETDETDAATTVGTRDYGFPYSQDDDAYYGRQGSQVPYDVPVSSPASGAYDASEGEGYEPYEPYDESSQPVDQESYGENGADSTAPYDWRWTKTSDSTTAPSAEATFT